jgi:hypothetical protein
MNPDVFLTIAFVFYAVVSVAAAGFLIARSSRDTVVDQAAESRLNGFSKALSPGGDRGKSWAAGRHR